MAVPVIVEYQASSGHGEQVAALLAGHWRLLNDEGFTTEQPAFLMRHPDIDDLFIEVFEWKSEEGPEEAWNNPTIAALWNEIQSHCDEDVEPEYFEMVSTTYTGGG